MKKVAVVGLGYVGLPLAVALGRELPTIGFDLDENKLANYRKGIDVNGEVDEPGMRAATQLEYTNDPKRLSEADMVIVAVPTPIDQARRPDLSPLLGASRTVGQNISPNTIVVFESTVYPGCTEDDCVPVLEKESGMAWLGREGADENQQGFYVGYSPERINPGDKEHRLENITKIVSGDTPSTLEKVAGLYERIITVGVHRASTIAVAEAAKVIENTQRDLNIALMNELALIFQRLGIDTQEVLEAAGTKWNFLKFFPGLVGGHCIGVDPYYLTYKAESVGYHPQVILAGRKINDNMGAFIAEQTVKRLIKADKPINGAKVIVLGLTFKEDCPDLRNSRVSDIIKELHTYCCDVIVHDPMAEKAEAKHEYNVDLVDWDALPKADAVVLAVGHKQYKALTVEQFQNIMGADGVLMDVKSTLDKQEFIEQGVNIWRL
ncbi:MAG: GDP-mannose dehydrogenase [Piscirickettsiaceae bacterium]|nr:MAG: GDP-mannose dehydrogenase [Piscirickettsiaceae bacterium]